jgi:hypothetical protein
VRNISVRLAVGEVPARNVSVEEVLEGQARPQRLRGDAVLISKAVEPDLAQEQFRVLRRGCGRRPDAGVLDGDDEPQRVGIGGEVAGLDEPDHHRLFTHRVFLGADSDIGHMEVLQGRPSAVHPSLARDLRLVDVGRERLGRPDRLVADMAPLALHQLTQRLTPCLLVRRVDEHAVDIEDRTPEP